MQTDLTSLKANFKTWSGFIWADKKVNNSKGNIRSARY